MFEQRNNRDSAHETSEDDIGRRLALARLVELTSIAPLAALGISNALGHRDYATIDSSAAARGAAALNVDVSELTTKFSKVEQALARLETEYRDAYHKSRIVPYMATNSKGQPTMRFRTEYYWAEENSVPRHSEISSWSSTIQQASNKAQELSKPELIDTEKIKQLLVKTQHVGSVSQIGGSILITGGQIAALLGYEEVAGLRESTHIDHGMEIESKEQLRRGFLKYGAVGAGIAAAFLVAGKINDRLHKGKERLNEAVSKANDQTEIQDESAFLGHFEATPEGLISGIASQRQQIEGSLKLGVSNGRVRAAMNDFALVAAQSEEALKLFFGDGVPPSVADRCRSVILTETINQARSGESALGETAVLIEGLAMGAAMTAVVVSLEAVSRRLPPSSAQSE